MDYKEKYEQALERARQFSEKPYLEDSAGIVEYIFPELKESEGERIRKEIRVYFATLLYDDNVECPKQESLERWIAWLEKQGEQKPKKCMYSNDNYTDEERKVFCDGCEEECELRQKQELSEEDELHIRELESLVKQVWAKAEHENDKETIHKMSDLSFFLKTLKPQPKQEWSEEDDQYLLVCKNALRKYQASDKWDAEIISRWLENKLKAPQSQWKPSERQKEALLWCVVHLGGADKQTLGELLEELNKLW